MPHFFLLLMRRVSLLRQKRLPISLCPPSILRARMISWLRTCCQFVNSLPSDELGVCSRMARSARFPLRKACLSPACCVPPLQLLYPASWRNRFRKSLCPYRVANEAGLFPRAIALPEGVCGGRPFQKGEFQSALALFYHAVRLIRLPPAAFSRFPP